MRFGMNHATSQRPAPRSAMARWWVREGRDSAGDGDASLGRLALAITVELLAAAWRCALKVLSIGDCHVH